VKRIILASASPRRQQLLKKLTDDFTAITPAVEEREYETPQLTAQGNARLKGLYAARKYPGAIIIACDTVVARGGKIYGKPKSEEEAVRMLKELGGKWHEVYSGMFIKADKVYEYCALSKVLLKELDDFEIREYVRSFRPLDKAGAYGIQDKAVVADYEGDYHNIVGMPLSDLQRILRENGIDVKEEVLC
jgi:septum formation protein